jgi:hypothetical protein
MDNKDGRKRFHAADQLPRELSHHPARTLLPHLNKYLLGQWQEKNIRSTAGHQQ